MSKFTPGPWNCDKRVGCVAVYAGEKVNCMSDLGEKLFYDDGYKKHNADGSWEWEVSEKSIANARLISAAPDMYEALNLLRDAINDAEINSSVKDVNNALYFVNIAISKANGGSPNA
jgi:hypothetical protein